MQKSFSDLEYAAKKKLTRRDRFLAEIDVATPWGQLHKLIEPHYPKVTGPSRPPIRLASMLRMYVAQLCFGPADEGIDDTIYDRQAIRASSASTSIARAHRTRRPCSSFATCSKRRD